MFLDFMMFSLPYIPHFYPSDRRLIQCFDHLLHLLHSSKAHTETQDSLVVLAFFHDHGSHDMVIPVAKKMRHPRLGRIGQIAETLMLSTVHVL